MDVEVRAAHGEVTEREDLLDGRVRVELAGEAAGWLVEAAFGWRRGRSGETQLDASDCFLTLTDGDRELHASVEAGTVAVDPETGAAEVEVRFAVEEVKGGFARPGQRLTGAFTLGIEAWSGELRFAADRGIEDATASGDQPS